MNIIDEMRIRGGMPSEAELVRHLELIRSARERAVSRPSWRERVLGSLARRSRGGAVRKAPATSVTVTTS
jgi:hypothetical protein